MAFSSSSESSLASIWSWTARIQWESSVVCGEIVLAIGISVYFVYHKINRHGKLLMMDPWGSHHFRLENNSNNTRKNRELWSLLLQPSWPQKCSMKQLFWFRSACFAWFLGVQVADMVRTQCKCLAFFTSWNFMVQTVYFFKAATRTRRLLVLESSANLRGNSPIARASYHPSEGDVTTELIGSSSSALSSSSGTRSAPSASNSMYVSLLAEGESPHDYSYEPSARSRQRHLRQSWLYLDVVFDVCLATSLLITIVVWTILYPYAVRHDVTDKLLNWASYCQHGANLVLLQLDFWLSHHVVLVDAVPLLVLWPTMYAIFAWILHETSSKHFWPYPFLRLDTPMAPVWYACLLAGHGVSFGVVYVCSRIKQSLLSR